MALVGFQQDPSGPPGLGTFHFDDGRQLYAHDPETAASIQPEQPNAALMGDAAAGPDMRTAANPFQMTDSRLDAAGPAPVDPQLNAMARAAAGNWAAGQPTAPLPPPPPPPPALAPQAPQPAIGASGPAHAQPEAPPDPQQEAVNFITAPVRVAPTRGGVIPKSQAMTVEQDGLPYDPALAEQRADANINMQVAKENTAQTLASRAQAESLQAQAQLPELQKRAAAAQAEVAEQQALAKRERAELEQMIAESQQNQKSFNANRWFESKGAIGQIGAVLAQAFGAYAATLGRTENWAKKIIDGYIDADIAEQREQIEAGKAGVNNALQRLNLRFGDIGQAQSALKIAMGQVVDTQIEAYAKSTKSEDIINGSNEWVAQNRAERVAHEQEFMAKAIGKRTTATHGTVVAPSAGGTRAPTTAEMSARADLAGKIPGIAEKSYDAELKRQKVFGGGDPDKMREDTRNLAKDTAEIVKAQAEAQPGRDLIQQYKGERFIPGLGLDYDAATGLPVIGAGVSRFALNDEERANRGTIDRAVLAYQHALTGAGASDRERGMITNAIKGARTPGELSAAIEQADAALAARRKSIEAGYDPRVVETWRKRGAYQPVRVPPSARPVTEDEMREYLRSRGNGD